MLFVTDPHGNVVAAAHTGESAVAGMNVAIVPFPGQTLQKVEVPELVTQMNGRDFHFFLSHARRDVETGRLILPEFRIRRPGER
ncbi:hypothetical protein HC031_11300 [Planosporangium thailandense]|uniref:Uncharacterized protein n=1 Tax=Planosporangium thailandense TaxID=765197 RepID=A0ABX0XW70_9ACTN|nr:hypothetical protein [Planosporangium thailandense]NJC70291.1 hypothetical protein [Planosporangium thailandense]